MHQRQFTQVVLMPLVACYQRIDITLQITLPHNYATLRILSQMDVHTELPRSQPRKNVEKWRKWRQDVTWCKVLVLVRQKQYAVPEKQYAVTRQYAILGGVAWLVAGISLRDVFAMKVFFISPILLWDRMGVRGPMGVRSAYLWESAVTTRFVGQTRLYTMEQTIFAGSQDYIGQTMIGATNR